MARRRRKNKSLWHRAPLTLAACALMAWGLWQALTLKRSILDPMQRITPLAAVDSQPFPQDISFNSPPPPPPTDFSAIPALSISYDAAPSIELLDPLPIISIQPAPPDPFPGLSAEELITQATSFLESGQIISARLALNAALARTDETGPAGIAAANNLRHQLTELNSSIFLGTAILPDDDAARLIEIQPGDSFLKLARQYALPASFLENINPSLNPRNLKPLTGVKIVEGPFHITLTKHTRRLDLYAKDLYIRSYKVELEQGSYLPKGEYQIAPGSKIQVNSHVWLGFQGIDQKEWGGGGGTVDITSGWLYGSTGPRRSNSLRDDFAGIKLSDPDLWQLYNTLTETQSLLRIDP